LPFPFILFTVSRKGEPENPVLSVVKVQTNIVVLIVTPGHKGHGGKIIIMTDLVYEKTKGDPPGDEGSALRTLANP
jgi:hypothetical protein